ncbi:MAG: aldo/keto reductase [Campylobacterales bacterium]|nr:aldo/keto reductase [Campylobacterales bacterium]
MAKIAFGTQRISEFNPQHIQALKEAIKSGTELIDTSSEYLDGSSHRAIAIAFRELDKSEIENVKIVSKFSYKADGDVVKNIDITLSQLNLEKIDCFMFFNLEYYLLDGIDRGISKDDRLDGMNKIVYKVFYELEEEIKNGKFDSYGISSENFSIEHLSDFFLPYEDLVSIARMAAKDAGNHKYSFTTIELPYNILERAGDSCIKWAKENQLRVLTSRPLNAIKDTKPYRLAQYDESKEYYNYLNELLEVSDNDFLKPLYNVIDELDSSKHKFAFVEDYDTFLFKEVIPHIKNVLENLDEDSQTTLLNYIDIFLQEYRKMVAYECSNKTRDELSEYFSDCFASMQECSLDFIAQNEDIDYILVGMRKPSYVAEVLSFV